MKISIIFATLVALYGVSAGPVAVEPESKASLNIQASWNLCVTNLWSVQLQGYNALVAVALSQMLKLSYWFGNTCNLMQTKMYDSTNSAAAVNLALASLTVTASCNNLKAALVTLNSSSTYYIQQADATCPDKAKPFKEMAKQMSGNITLIYQGCIQKCTPLNAFLFLSATLSDTVYQQIIFVHNTAAKIANGTSVIYSESVEMNPFIAFCMDIITVIINKQQYIINLVMQVQAQIQVAVSELMITVTQVVQEVVQETVVVEQSLTVIITTITQQLSMAVEMTSEIICISNETINAVISVLIEDAKGFALEILADVKETEGNVTDTASDNSTSGNITGDALNNVTNNAYVVGNSSSVAVSLCSAMIVPQQISAAKKGHGCVGQCVSSLKKMYKDTVAQAIQNITLAIAAQITNFTMCLNGSSSFDTTTTDATTTTTGAASTTTTAAETTTTTEAATTTTTGAASTTTTGADSTTTTGADSTTTTGAASTTTTEATTTTTDATTTTTGSSCGSSVEQQFQLCVSATVDLSFKDLKKLIKDVLKEFKKGGGKKQLVEACKAACKGQADQELASLQAVFSSCK